MKQDSTLREDVAKLLHKWIHNSGSPEWESKKNPETVRVSYRKRADQIHALYAPVIEAAEKSGYDYHVRHMFSIEKAQSLKITELRERLDAAYTKGLMANKPEIFEAGKKEGAKEEHESMIKCCVDEGNDAYKRGATKERERIAHDIGGAISLLFVCSYSACMKRLVEIRQTP